MLGIENFHLFVVAGLILNITPGPDMLYVIARSASQGRSAGLVSSLAIASGSLVHTAAAALGLSALLMYSALGFTVIKWVGAGYLIYLGVKTLLAARKVDDWKALRRESLRRIFLQGVLVNVLNPKVALFFLAFLPQFANPDSDLFVWQIIFLGLFFNFTGTMVNSLVALFAGYSGRWLSRRGVRRAQSWLCGFVFIALGVGVAAAERN